MEFSDNKPKMKLSAHGLHGVFLDAVFPGPVVSPPSSSGWLWVPSLHQPWKLSREMQVCSFPGILDVWLSMCAACRSLEVAGLGP